VVSTLTVDTIVSHRCKKHMLTVCDNLYSLFYAEIESYVDPNVIDSYLPTSAHLSYFIPIFSREGKNPTEV